MSKLAKKPTTPKPTEPVITRNKSIEEGRQLRKKDRSMKSITQLLKSSHQKSKTAGQTQKPVKSKKSPAKKPASSPKARIKETPPTEKLSENVLELHPDIIKRDIASKKTFLKPKYEMKVIARANKRKLKTPQKGVPNTCNNDTDTKSSDKKVEGDLEMRSFDSEMTMADFVRLAEEADCLDDDDLMEILTCPSPVWWEDPPDANYMEDPIVLRIPTSINENKNDPVVNNLNNNIFNDSNGTLDIIVRKNDERLDEKTKKLEKILGNLKTKFDLRKNNEINNSKRFDKETTINLNNDSKEIITNNINNEMKIERNSSSIECDNVFSDIIINGEELLRDLESMDIPIQNDANSPTNNEFNNSVSKKSRHDNNIVKIKLIDKSGKDSITIKGKTYEELMKNMKQSSRSLLKNVSRKVSNDTAMDIESDSISEVNLNIDEADQAKPNVTKCIEQGGSKDTLLRNTQFFVNKDMKQLVTVSKDTESLCDFEKQMDKSDCITVYKIKTQNLPNPGVEETSLLKTKELDIDGKEIIPETNFNANKLNVFYKKCKTSLNNGKQAVKKQKVSVKNLKCNYCRRNTFLAIPDTDKKLCLGCSSIYEENCTFCEGNTSEKCTCALKQMKMMYSCKECEFQTATATSIRKHMVVCHRVKSTDVQSWYRRYNRIHFT